jgi:hypothetical protein
LPVRIGRVPRHRPHRQTPERDRRLVLVQNLAIALMCLGVVILVYLAIATTR